MLIIEGYKIPTNSADMMREMVRRGETLDAVFFVIQRVYGENFKILGL